MRQAVSADGATFRAKDEVVLDRASVPDAVRWQDRIHLYFVNGEAGAHGIWLAKPTGASGVLAKRCVLLDGRFVGDAVDPDVVRVSAEGLRMFYFLDISSPVADRANASIPSMARSPTTG